MTRSRAAIFSGYIFVFLMSLVAGGLYALENTFTVSANVIAQDIIAPTVPTALIATPASGTQINLSWNASTDSVGVIGYRVYRDGVIIATSTTNSYNDIGLFYSTQYAYNVDAFDAALNISALSATTTATTLPEPTVTPDDGRRRSSSRSFSNDSIELNVRAYEEMDSAVLTWDTNAYARANVYWGQTSDYELGIISGVIYQKSHVVKIENLIPGTEYMYRLELETNDGENYFYQNSFTTLPDVSVRPPQSIVLTANAQNDQIQLVWNKPVEEGMQVRLVRSDKFFPVDPYDGKVMYQGTRDTEFTDSAVQQGVTYYYALFVIDENEMYSAPSIAKGALGMAETPVFSEAEYSAHYETLLRDLTLTDFDFIQKGVKLSFSAGGINLSSDSYTEIIVDAEKIPLGIKTIGVTFIPTQTKTDPVTFLLMYSKEKDKYIGVIPQLDAGQMYEIEINIFDTLNNKVKTLHIAARVEAKVQATENYGYILQMLHWIADNIIAVTIILSIGFLIGFMARRL